MKKEKLKNNEVENEVEFPLEVSSLPEEEKQEEVDLLSNTTEYVKAEEDEVWTHIIDGVKYREVTDKEKSDIKPEDITPLVESLKDPEVPVGSMKILHEGEYAVSTVVLGTYEPAIDYEAVGNIQCIDFETPGLSELYGYLTYRNSYPMERTAKKVLTSEDGKHVEIEEILPDDWSSALGRFILPYIPKYSSLDPLKPYPNTLRMPDSIYKQAVEFMTEILTVMLYHNNMVIPLDQDFNIVENLLDTKAFQPMPFVNVLVSCFCTTFKNLGYELKGDVRVLGDPEAFWRSEKILTTHFKSTFDHYFRMFPDMENMLLIRPVISTKYNENGRQPITKLQITFKSKEVNTAMCLLCGFVKKPLDSLAEFELRGFL